MKRIPVFRKNQILKRLADVPIDLEAAQRRIDELNKQIAAKRREHMNYLGALGLLAECAVYVPEEVRQMIEQALEDGRATNPDLQWKRILDHIEIGVSR